MLKKPSTKPAKKGKAAKPNPKIEDEQASHQSASPSISPVPENLSSNNSDGSSSSNSSSSSSASNSAGQQDSNNEKAVQDPHESQEEEACELHSEASPQQPSSPQQQHQQEQTAENKSSTPHAQPSTKVDISDPWIFSAVQRSLARSESGSPV